MTIVFTSPIIEYPAAGGPQLRIENTIKALSNISEVVVVSGQRPKSKDDARTVSQHFSNWSNRFSWYPSVKARPSKNRIIRIVLRISGRIRRLGELSVKRDARYLIKEADENNAEIIWFGYGNISFPLIQSVHELRPDLKTVCDTDSVWSRFLLRGLPYATTDSEKIRIQKAGERKIREERAWVNLCDVTTAVSEVDAEYYRSLASEKNRIWVFSNVIDSTVYGDSTAEAKKPPVGFEEKSVYLAGSYGANSPMNNAAQWMIDKVMPLVWAQDPNVHLYLVGRNSDRYFGSIDSPSITVTGMLPSVIPYLSNAGVAVVPLKFESGTRFKILEAGACMTPVVSTTLGAEGLPVTNREHLLIADEPAGFADAIIELLSDSHLSKKLAEGLKNIVERDFSVEALAQEGKKIIDYLQSKDKTNV